MTFFAAAFFSVLLLPLSPKQEIYVGNIGSTQREMKVKIPFRGEIMYCMFPCTPFPVYRTKANP